MAHFVSLPNKLKLQIIETTARNDIDNLALCCKLVHGLAVKALRQHRADKRMYSR